MATVEQITDPLAFHGEGPVWDSFADRLCWLDMLAGDVLCMVGDTIERHHVGNVVAAIRPRESGGSVLALERGFAFADAAFLDVKELPPVFTDRRIRMNDGGCDMQGRFYCGTMAFDATPEAGTLFRLDLDGSTQEVFDRVTVSNGLAWSPDGGTAYYVDSATQRIDAFDFDASDGAFTRRRTVVSIDAHSGTPDGLTVDFEGRLWVALWDGAAVRAYTAGGALEEVISLPVARVTACTFGGPDLAELFITTSRFGLTDPEANAGALFRASVGVRGIPTSSYKG